MFCYNQTITEMRKVLRMTYLTTLPSPVGPLLLASDGRNLTGLWLENQKYFASGLDRESQKAPTLPVFRETRRWLDDYFAGRCPPALPPLAPAGTAFRQAVWKRLLEIPYGRTSTYGALAEELGSSPRAVGSAVGRNPISILIPCHRVLGADGSMTGYAGGVEKKRFLLALEQSGLEHRKKTPVLPEVSCPSPVRPQEEPEAPVPGSFPCPCCGYRTFPVPKEDAVAYICPVCFWENDVFDPGEDQPSDENGGVTLRQAREAFLRLGAVREDLIQYVRKPLPEEMP